MHFFARFVPLNVDLESGFTVRDLIQNESSRGLSTLESLTPPTHPDLWLRDLLYNKGLNNCKLFFTDGSKIPGVGVGSAIFCEDPHFNLKYNLNNLNSIFEAEAIAILHALRIIFEDSLSPCVIISDSLSVLSALSSIDGRGHAHYLIHMMRECIHQISGRKLDVTFIWMPGHSGLSGNETVDELAKEGAKNETGTSEHAKILFPINLFDSFKRETYSAATLFLKNQAHSKGFRYFNKVKMKELVPWFVEFPKLPRNIITLISRIRSHHVTLAAHLFEKGLKDSAECTCGMEETIEHAFRCNRRGDESARLMVELYRAGAPPSSSIIDIAFSDNRQAFLLLEQFVRKSDLTL